MSEVRYLNDHHKIFCMGNKLVHMVDEHNCWWCVVIVVAGCFAQNLLQILITYCDMPQHRMRIGLKQCVKLNLHCLLLFIGNVGQLYV